jgi:hypothetical protein
MVSRVAGRPSFLFVPFRRKTEVVKKCDNVGLLPAPGSKTHRGIWDGVEPLQGTKRYLVSGAIPHCDEVPLLYQSHRAHPHKSPPSAAVRHCTSRLATPNMSSKLEPGYGRGGARPAIGQELQGLQVKGAGF